MTAFNRTAYVRQLHKLLPPGVAFDELQPQLRKLLEALADELVRIEGRGIDLINESDPRTADETIADWERMLSIPDDQVPVIPGSLAERRLAVTAKYVTRGGQNVAFFVALAAACGYTLEDRTLATPVITSVSLESLVGGSLFSAIQTYEVSAVSPYGESTPSAQVTDGSFVFTHTNQMRVTWDPVDGAIGYRVFGRSPGAGNLCLAFVPAGTEYWIDDGSSFGGDSTPAGPNPLAYKAIEKFASRVCRVGARVGDRLYGRAYAYAMLLNPQTPGGPALAQDVFERVIRHHTHAHIVDLFVYHP